MTDSPDVVVLGAGPAGEAAAGRLARGGLSVVLVEREHVGGECAFWACMPSKALLRPAELADEIGRVGGVREGFGDGSIDVPAVLARRDEVIHGLDDSGHAGDLEEAGVEIVRGTAALAGERRVRVGERELEARRAVVVATGTSAAIPPVDGLAEAEPWTNRRGTTAGVVPGRLLVVGGGVVGCELAQAWSSLGARVTLVEVADRLLAGEEEFAAAMVADGLRSRGVEVRTGVTVERAAREGGEGVLVLEGGEELRGDALLVAAGRHPNTDGLGLAAAGLEDGEPIPVGDDMRVAGHPWLFAVGDVNGRALLTHQGKHQARIAADRILGREVRDTAPVPRVVFTQPQVASVGHTLASAREAGLHVRAVDHPTDATAGGSFVGHGAPSLTRIVIDEDRNVLAGATFVGPEIVEFVHAATIAVAGEVPLDRLWQAVPCFPTRSEVWLRLLEKAGL